MEEILTVVNFKKTLNFIYFTTITYDYKLATRWYCWVDSHPVVVHIHVYTTNRPLRIGHWGLLVVIVCSHWNEKFSRYCTGRFVWFLWRGVEKMKKNSSTYRPSEKNLPSKKLIVFLFWSDKQWTYIHHLIFGKIPRA